MAAGDHYEVLFSPTGDVHLDKVIQNTRYRLFSGRHNAPPHHWFTVALVRRAQFTTVKVNEEVIFDSVFQLQLGPGEIGVVTHWSRASFDTLSVSERLDRSYPFENLIQLRF